MEDLREFITETQSSLGESGDRIGAGVFVFSPKGWDPSAQGKERSDAALGRGGRSQSFGLPDFAVGTQGVGPSALALG